MQSHLPMLIVWWSPYRILSKSAGTDGYPARSIFFDILCMHTSHAQKSPEFSQMALIDLPDIPPKSQCRLQEARRKFVADRPTVVSDSMDLDQSISPADKWVRFNRDSEKYRIMLKRMKLNAALLYSVTQYPEKRPKQAL